MPCTWIGTSWKMNKTIAEAVSYARALKDEIILHIYPVQVFVVSPFTALAAVCTELKGTPVMVGAQNMHWEEKGAFTGEISPLMVCDCGAQLVEIGHSERRGFFCETDEVVNRKVQAALQHGLRPIICVGESAADKKMEVAEDVIRMQVKKALYGVAPEQADRILLAYEPVWAIGDAGTPASPEYAQKIHAIIRKVLHNSFGEQIARSLPVLYGGSVNQENAARYVQEADIDGLFIGRSAWMVESFFDIIKLTLPAQDQPLRI